MSNGSTLGSNHDAVAGLSAELIGEVNSVLSKLMTSINSSDPSLIPLITSLRHPGMRERHWSAINTAIAAAVIGTKHAHLDVPKQDTHPLFFRPDAPTSLSALLSAGVSEHEAVIFEVCQAAAKEHAVELQLDNLITVWKTTSFDVVPHASSGSYFLRGIPELMITLDEHLTITQTLSAMQHNSQHAVSILKWMKTFNHAADVLAEFTEVQSQWLQLGPLFHSPELIEALPVEVKLFNVVDKLYKRLILSVRRGNVYVWRDNREFQSICSC